MRHWLYFEKLNSPFLFSDLRIFQYIYHQDLASINWAWAMDTFGHFNKKDNILEISEVSSSCL